MARAYKYYGATIMIRGDMLKRLKELGYKGSHSQFRIVCKAKSMVEAVRIAESYGINKSYFTGGYIETGNGNEIEMADKYGLIISIDGNRGFEYVGIEELSKGVTVDDSKKYKVIKAIDKGWESGADIGDILTVSYWGGAGCSALTLMKEDKAVCDLDSQCAKECCEEIK